MASHRPRTRRRRRRRFSRFLLKSMLLSFTALALIIGATIFFKLETITVEGNSHYSVEEIISATKISLGENLFSIPKSEIAQNITHSLPYIQSLEIKLQLPTGIKLVVQEQVGMVKLVTSQGTWIMGVQGKLLESTELSPQEVFDSLELELESSEDFVADSLASQEEEIETISLVNLSESSLEPQEELWSDINEWDPETPFVIDCEPQDFALDYSQLILTVTGLDLVEPAPGEIAEVATEDMRKLQALLTLFDQLESHDLYQSVTKVHVHAFNYLEFDYEERFLVRLPLVGDYSYKLRALLSAVSETEDYETGTMDLTQEQYAVLFMPD